QGSDTVLIKKTKDVQRFDGLSEYLESSFKYLNVHASDMGTSLFYSAKDIPLFYTVNTNLLSKFKLYVWLYLLNLEDMNMSFDSFCNKAPIIYHSHKLTEFYTAVQINEIWNDTTIRSEE